LEKLPTEIQERGVDVGVVSVLESADRSESIRSSFSQVNPNPGGMVANMTSKTQNCCDKFIIHKKLKKVVIFSIRVLCLIFYKQVFYQNNVLFDYSTKMSRFMPILGFCADAFRAACS
jgi:hypothetical protein